jgi:hypothetical protein
MARKLKKLRLYWKDPDNDNRGTLEEWCRENKRDFTEVGAILEKLGVWSEDIVIEVDVENKTCRVVSREERGYD